MYIHVLILIIERKNTLSTSVTLLNRCGRSAKLSKTMTIAENTGTIDICESLVLRNS